MEHVNTAVTDRMENGRETWTRSNLRMIWYFIAGFISGFVGAVMLGSHITKKRGDYVEIRSEDRRKETGKQE